MSELERLIDQLTRAFEGPAWCGLSVTESLADVSAELAFSHPIPNAHSIAELALHIATWERTIRRVILDEGEFTVTDDENFPPITDTSDAAWKTIIQELVKGHLALRAAAATFDPRRFDEIPVGARSSFYVLMHGVVQHDLYHAAQIVLLKKK